MIFTDRSKAVSFVDHFLNLCLMFVFVMQSGVFLEALRLPAEKELTSWLSCVMLSCVFVTFTYGVPDQV